MITKKKLRLPTSALSKMNATAKPAKQQETIFGGIIPEAPKGTFLVTRAAPRGIGRIFRQALKAMARMDIEPEVTGRTGQTSFQATAENYLALHAGTGFLHDQELIDLFARQLDFDSKRSLFYSYPGLCRRPVTCQLFRQHAARAKKEAF